MCGIAGFVFADFNEDQLKKMTRSLTHRGPDSEGFYYNNKYGLGLGHRRLSILDTSVNGNQPMKSHCTRYTMVYNGEVYNFKELKSELNRVWRSSSDSEVILEAFVEYGINFTDKLNGMFAIAIWDQDEKKMYLFRDRLGIKPLYYFYNGSSFIFSSEIKSIVDLNMPLSINKKAVYNYFSLGFPPQKESIYNEIKQLDAGSYGVVIKNEFTVKRYWRANVNDNSIISFNDAKSNLDELLQKSIEYRLISDVSIGTFLSGGTDSSLVTAIASKLSSKPINTFSIGFKESQYNESKQAKKIASYLKTDHHEFIVSYNDAIDNLEKVMENFDQPFVDSSALPTYVVSKLAREHVTVALSGDGGDELFMGYGSYRWLKRLNNPIIWNSKKMISSLLSMSKNNRHKRAAFVFNASNKKDLISHIFSQEQYLFSSKEIDQLLIFKYIDKADNYSSSHSNYLNQSLFEINNYLKEDLLVKVDRASMLNSLEVRVPLLDHNIVNYALSLPDHFKMNGDTQKFILKEVLYQYIPKNMLNYPKWGFSIPLNQWLKNELYYLIEKYLNDKLIQEQNIFNAKFVKDLKLRFLSGEDYLYNRIWQLIIFNKFYCSANAKWD